MIYARTISVSRPNRQTGVGAQGYAGYQTVGESVLFTAIPASIQLTRRVGQPDPGLPGDAASQMGYDIYIPLSYLSLGDVTERDVITDDLGKRYQVIGAYWNILGYNLSVVLLES